MKAKVLRIISLEEAVKRNSIRPEIINHIDANTEQEQEALKKKLVTVYDSQDVFLDVPQCECGGLTGGHYVDCNGNGTVCPTCHTEVTNPTDRKIESSLFFAAPEGIKRLITPLAWIILSEQMIAKGRRDFNFLSYILNPSYRDPEDNAKAMAFVDAFKASGIERGINSFFDNYELILDICYHLSKSADKDDWLECCITFKNEFFTKILLIPSKIAFAIEKTSLGTYYDNSMNSCIDAVFTATSLENLGGYDNAPRNIRRQINTHLAKILEGFGTYAQVLWVENLQKKNAWLRKAIYGCRMNLSFRTIVTSRHEPHDYRKIKMPYAIMLNVYQPLVYSKLIYERGYNMKQATKIIETGFSPINPLLWELLEELINETPPEEPSFAMEGHERYQNLLKTQPKRIGRGLETTNTRYPTLDRLSTQLYYIDAITEHTTEVPLQTVIGPNMDFDGDMTQGTVTYGMPGFNFLQPHYGLHSTMKPFQIRHIASLPDTIVVMKYQARVAEEWVI